MGPVVTSFPGTDIDLTATCPGAPGHRYITAPPPSTGYAPYPAVRPRCPGTRCVLFSTPCILKSVPAHRPEGGSSECVVSCWLCCRAAGVSESAWRCVEFGNCNENTKIRKYRIVLTAALDIDAFVNLRRGLSERGNTSRLPFQYGCQDSLTTETIGARRSCFQFFSSFSLSLFRRELQNGRLESRCLLGHRNMTILPTAYARDGTLAKF